MKNVFVRTKNVTVFVTALKEAEKAGHAEALLVFYGQAGRGKTSVARWYAANEAATYARALTGWTPLWMLQDLCFELQIDPIPKRSKPAFEAVISRLRQRPRTMILDEADKLGPLLLDWIRDLADKTFVPFALVGEKGLLPKMTNERRLWSRTLRVVEFAPISAKDILFFSKEAADLALTADQAELLRQASDGDFRLVARDVRRLSEIVQANQPGPGGGPGKSLRASDDTVKGAIRQGLRG